MSSPPALPPPMLLPLPTPAVLTQVLSTRMACIAVALAVISRLALTSWACCVDRMMPMGAMISPLFQRHCCNRQQRGVRGNHCNFHLTRSLPAEDGIADCCVMGWTNVVMPSAGKEVAVTTSGPSAPAGKTLRIQMGPGGVGGGRPRTLS